MNRIVATAALITTTMVCDHEPSNTAGRLIDKRPVDTSTDVPGEVLHPTQPLLFGQQGVSLNDASDLPREIRAFAVAEMQRFRLGPSFTLLTLQETLQRPGTSNGANSGNNPRVNMEYSNSCPYGAAPSPERGLGPISWIILPWAHLLAISLNEKGSRGRCHSGTGARRSARTRCCSASPFPSAGHMRRLWTVGDPGQFRHARRRHLGLVCLRQVDGRRTLTQRDAVSDHRNADDLSDTIKAAVRDYRHRWRCRRGARRLRAIRAVRTFASI